MKKLPAAPNVATLPRRRPTRAEAEEAVRTLLAWSGDNPDRPGLAETPARVAAAYGEYFSGYALDAHAELAATFEERTGFDDMVLLKGVDFESHCEHHIAPFHGVAHVAYIPNGKIVGLSKLARVVEIYAHRLQTQETLTAEIAEAIMGGLDAKGVAVVMRAKHHCMSGRGVRQQHAETITMRLLGLFETDEAWRQRFLATTLGPGETERTK